MKKYVLPALIFFAFLFIVYQYIQENVKETFSVNVQTTDEIKDELIIALLVDNIENDVQSFYSQFYTGEIEVYNYEITILKVEKEDTKSITVKVGVTPQVGAHNPLGYDELDYRVDARGNITLKSYEHVKTYAVPE